MNIDRVAASRTGNREGDVTRRAVSRINGGDMVPGRLLQYLRRLWFQ
jgi:hypothetical protein